LSVFRQWGNLLTLAATFKDPTLGRFVEGPVLKDLFRKTIVFFQATAQKTSALNIDKRILEGLMAELWGHSDAMDPRASLSFSSNMSNGMTPLPPLTPVGTALPPPPPPPPSVMSPTLRTGGQRLV
jgi:hypothetical protein